MEAVVFSLKTGSQWTGPEEIVLNINEPAEFDGLSRDEVMALRAKVIAEHSELMDGEYAYSKTVFSGIQDGLKWWGLEGQLCHGAGPLSAEGLSGNSIFILNPFVPVMVNNTLSYASKDPVCFPVVPFPAKVLWRPLNHEMLVTYDMGSFLAEIVALHGSKNLKQLTLSGLNARDFGYHFVYADPQQSLGVRKNAENSMFDDIHQIQDFIQVLQNCQQPSGCNSISPLQPPMDFTVEFLPAQISIKLWRKLPQSKSQTADMTVKIILE